MHPWTLRQRVAVGVIVGVVLSIAVVRYSFNRSYVSDPQPLEPLRAADLADKIDPNTADIATLSALPLIGDGRARAIVAYRDEQLAKHPGLAAFKKPSDLLRVKGIGNSIVKQLEGYLLFPAPGSASDSDGANP